MQETYYFRVNGMEDAGSETEIERALKFIEGVEFIEADYETGMVVVKSTIAVAKVVKTINSAGFNAIHVLA